jgi:hypothetical protein
VLGQQSRPSRYGLGLRAAAEPIFRARTAFQAFLNSESQIFTLRGNGTGTRRVSHATNRSENRNFPPDGRSMAYEHSFSIYIAASDGSDRWLVVRDGRTDVVSSRADLAVHSVSRRQRRRHSSNRERWHGAEGGSYSSLSAQRRARLLEPISLIMWPRFNHVDGDMASLSRSRRNVSLSCINSACTSARGHTYHCQRG